MIVSFKISQIVVHGVICFKISNTRAILETFSLYISARAPCVMAKRCTVMYVALAWLQHIPRLVNRSRNDVDLLKIFKLSHLC